MINDFKTLKDKINKCIVKALEVTRKTIGEVLKQKTQDYYDEYVPNQYERTYLLMNSLVNLSEYSIEKGKVEKRKLGYGFKVGWDNAYLDFQYIEIGVTGEMVLRFYNDQSHGGVSKDNNGDPFEHRFFSEAIEELGGEEGIKKIFLANLKKNRIAF